VQVAAYPDRQDAERLAKQLATKGYPAFVLDPVQGAPTKLFRVRVGKYPNRNAAESVQAQLVKAEPQFSAAWIAR
jgi:cell division septation protein DedD